MSGINSTEHIDTARLVTLDEFAARAGMSVRQIHTLLRHTEDGRAYYDLDGYPVAKIKMDRRHVRVHLADVIAALEHLRITPEAS